MPAAVDEDTSYEMFAGLRHLQFGCFLCKQTYSCERESALRGEKKKYCYGN